MESLSLLRVIQDVSLVRPLGIPPSFPVSSAIIMEWMRDQESPRAMSEGLALFVYLYHLGDEVDDPEMRAIAAATVSVKISGNYSIIDILDREEARNPGFKRLLWKAEFAVLKNI